MASMTTNDLIFFISRQRIGAIRPDGTGECYPEFRVPNQAYWQLRLVLNDGRRAILWSQEPPRNPQASFYDKDGLAFAKTHLWLYDFAGAPTTDVGGAWRSSPGGGMTRARSDKETRQPKER